VTLPSSQRLLAQRPAAGPATPRLGLREGLVRGVVAAVVLGVLAAALDLVLYGRLFRADLLAGAGLGLLAAPLAWLEHRAGPRPSALGWPALALWTAAGAFVGAFGIAVQVAYSEAFLAHGGWEAAVGAATEGAWLAAYDPLTAPVVALVALPLFLAGLARAILGARPRAGHLAGGATVTALVGGAVAWLVLDAIGAGGFRRQVLFAAGGDPLPLWGLPSGPQAVAGASVKSWSVARFVLGWASLAGAALPLAYRLADALALRWRRATDDEPAVGTPVEEAADPEPKTAIGIPVADPDAPAEDEVGAPRASEGSPDADGDGAPSVREGGGVGAPRASEGSPDADGDGAPSVIEGDGVGAPSPSEWSPAAETAHGGPARLVPWLVVAAAVALAVGLAAHSDAHPAPGRVSAWIGYAQSGGGQSMAGRALERIDERDARIVPTLLTELRAREFFRRRWALELLTRIGPSARDQAEEELIALVGDADVRISVLAIRALAALESGAAAEELLDVYMTDDGREGAAAYAALGAIDFAWDLDLVLPYLEGAGRRSREKVFDVIADKGPEAADAVPAILEVVEEEQAWHDERMAEALRAIGPAAHEAIEDWLFEAELPEDDWQARQARSSLLQNLGQTGLDELSLSLLARAAGDEDANRRAEAANALSWALYRSRREGAADAHRKRALLLLLDLARDEEERVRDGTQWGLQSIDAAGALTLLEEDVGSEDPAERIAAAEAIVHLSGQDRGVDEVLTELRADEDPAVREAIARALGSAAASEQARTHLLALARDRVVDVRVAGLAGLGGHWEASDEAFRLLAVALNDPRAPVRATAALALADALDSSRSYVSFPGEDGADARERLRPVARRLVDVLLGVIDAPEGERPAPASQAIEGLGAVGAEVPGVVLPRLEGYVRDAEARRVWEEARPAVEALSRIGTPEAQTALLTGLAATEPDVRQSLVSGLRFTNGNLRVFLTLLGDEVNGVQQSAANTLQWKARWSLDDEQKERAVKRVVEVLADEEDDTTKQALRQLLTALRG